jgi:hypothetical protein
MPQCDQLGARTFRRIVHMLDFGERIYKNLLIPEVMIILVRTVRYSKARVTFNHLCCDMISFLEHGIYLHYS